jgi:hypothetical protein
LVTAVLAADAWAGEFFGKIVSAAKQSSGVKETRPVLLIDEGLEIQASYNVRLTTYPYLSFCSAACVVCHCMFDKASRPTSTAANCS